MTPEAVFVLLAIVFSVPALGLAGYAAWGVVRDAMRGEMGAVLVLFCVASFMLAMFFARLAEHYAEYEDETPGATQGGEAQ